MRLESCFLCLFFNFCQLAVCQFSFWQFAILSVCQFFGFSVCQFLRFAVFHLTLEVDVVPQLNVVWRQTPPVLDLGNWSVCKQIFCHLLRWIFLWHSFIHLNQNVNTMSYLLYPWKSASKCQTFQENKCCSKNKLADMVWKRHFLPMFRDLHQPVTLYATHLVILSLTIQANRPLNQAWSPQSLTSPAIITPSPLPPPPPPPPHPQPHLPT